jgi:hypothetical protein
MRTIFAFRSPGWNGAMAFQLKAKESLSDGIARNVRRQIEKAIDHLDSNRKPPQGGTRAHEAVPNEVRKCFKKLRAAIRLVREELGDDVYREANYCFRDAARLLSEVCDAVRLVDAVDKLKARLPAAVRADLGARHPHGSGRRTGSAARRSPMSLWIADHALPASKPPLCI